MNLHVVRVCILTSVSLDVSLDVDLVKPCVAHSSFSPWCDGHI